MSLPDTLTVRRTQFDRAAELGLLNPEAVDPLWRHLAAQAAAPSGPRFGFVNVLYYLGGMLAIGAATLFMTQGFERLGPWGLLVIALVYLGGCIWAGARLAARDLEVPAGIMATLAICLVPLAAWALQQGLGLWPPGGPERYAQVHTRIDWRWLTLELVTLAAAAVALWRLRYPFLMMPVAFTLWYMSMDLARLVVAPAEPESWAFYRDFSIFFGLVMALVGLWIDIRSRGPGGSRRDYAFWPTLLGVATFWCALTARPAGDELARLLYMLLNLGMVLFGAVIARRIYAVCGAFGVAAYLGHLSHRVFADSLLFPVALTAIGFAVIAAGIAWQRHEPALQSRLRLWLPQALRPWLPPLP